MQRFGHEQAPLSPGLLRRSLPIGDEQGGDRARKGTIGLGDAARVVLRRDRRIMTGAQRDLGVGEPKILPVRRHELAQRVEVEFVERRPLA